MTPTDAMIEPLLTAEEVAVWLRRTPAWVYAHANGNRKPQLPSIKMGRPRLFRRLDVERWLEELARAA